jgi:three-Cys-motif partner protein
MRQKGRRAKIPTCDWLKSRLDRLTKMTEIVQTVSPEQYSEADLEYGFWSIKKEIALMYWIYPFQQIASIYFKRGRYYIDMFAGSGLMKAEKTFFVGSPIVAVNSTIQEKGFSEYICIELDEARKIALEKRMKAICSHFGTSEARVFQGDCNAKLETILKQHCPTDDTCFLAFVDPQGFSDLKWATLQKLMVHGTGDIILNFPTMGINRCLMISECTSTLTDFFGDESWADFGNNIDEILNHFKNNITRYRSQVESLEVKDEQNRRLYDLIFATNSQGMKNVLDDLKDKLNKIQTKDIRGLYAVVAEGQKQLPDF